MIYEKEKLMGVRICFIISNQARALMWVFEKLLHVCKFKKHLSFKNIPIYISWTLCKMKHISVPEDLLTDLEHLLITPEHCRNCPAPEHL